MQLVIFVIFALVTLGAALGVVLSHSVLRSALWLILSFFGIAGIFVLLEAEFVAVVQVLVYVGAIATLIIFAGMLSRNYLDPNAPRFNEQYGLVAGFAALLFVALAVVVTRVQWPAAAGQVPADAIQRLGTDFVGAYAVPFEVASVLLVVAMIGAIIIAREKES
ncbi:MAG TPA: NADH-quinone oxidoreductase subunit J [Anaerolineae bacterium]